MKYIIVIFLFTQSAEKILREVDSSAFKGASFSIVRQVIQTSGGKKREFLIKLYQKDYGKKMLFRYIEPARVEGTSFLFTEEGIWAYFPKTKRIRRIASSVRNERLMGSSFSYEDISLSGTFSEKYEPELLGSEIIKEEDCFILKLKPKKKTTYEELILWVRKKDYIPSIVEFYKDGKLVKRLREEKIEVIEGQPTPTKFTMEEIEDGTMTLMEIQEVDYNVSLLEDFFSLRELKNE